MSRVGYDTMVVSMNGSVLLIWATWQPAMGRSQLLNWLYESTVVTLN